MPVRVANWDRQAGILLDPAAAMKAGPNMRLAEGVDPASFAAYCLGRLNSISLQWRVQNEFNNLKPTLDADIRYWADNNATGYCYDPGNVGALVHLVIWQGDAPLGTPPPQGFVTLFEADCGLDPISVFHSYIATPAAFMGAPANTQLYYVFFWYTLDYSYTLDPGS